MNQYKHDTYFFIHNAGIHGPIGKIDNLDYDKWIETFQINLFSGVLILQHILKNILTNGGGCIFLAGGGSAGSMPNFTSYSCSKSSIVRLVENISEEYPKLRAHCISPGPNKTRLLNEAINNGVSVNENRIVQTDKVFDLCEYLISNDCSNLSGRQIHVKEDYKKINFSKLLNDEYKLRRFINENN